MLGFLKSVLGNLKAKGEKLSLEAEPGATTSASLDWQEVLRKSPEAFWAQDKKQNILEEPLRAVNQYACRLLGYDEKALLAMSLGDLLCAGDAAFREDLAVILLAGGPFRFTAELRGADGKRVTVDVRGGSLEQGPRTMLFYLARESLAKNNYASRQQQMQAVYRSAFNLLPAGVFVCSADAKLVRFNEAFTRMLGFNSARELRAMTSGDLNWLLADAALARRGDKALPDCLDLLNGLKPLRCRDGKKKMVAMRVMSRRENGGGGGFLYGLVQEPFLFFGEGSPYGDYGGDLRLGCGGQPDCNWILIGSGGDLARKDMKRMGKIYISQFDKDRLESLISYAWEKQSRDKRHLQELREELDAAEVIRPDEVPDNVVTMNSVVKVRDLDTGGQVEYRLVFPGDADPASNRISVLAPVGTALIGTQVGGLINWESPSGVRRLLVDELIYQPEAAGDYHL